LQKKGLVTRIRLNRRVKNGTTICFPQKHMLWTPWTVWTMCVVFFIKRNLEASIFLKCTQLQCISRFDNSTSIYKGLKTLHPGGIRTHDLLFRRRTWWPLFHAARAM
jgi:hypothetical protein